MNNKVRAVLHLLAVIAWITTVIEYVWPYERALALCFILWLAVFGLIHIMETWIGDDVTVPESLAFDETKWNG